MISFQFVQNEEYSFKGMAKHFICEHTPCLMGTITGTVYYGLPEGQPYQPVQTFRSISGSKRFKFDDIGQPNACTRLMGAEMEPTTGVVTLEWEGLVRPETQYKLVYSYEYNCECQMPQPRTPIVINLVLLNSHGNMLNISPSAAPSNFLSVDIFSPVRYMGAEHDQHPHYYRIHYNCYGSVDLLSSLVSKLMAVDAHFTIYDVCPNPSAEGGSLRVLFENEPNKTKPHFINYAKI